MAVLPEHYETLSAVEKQAIIWRLIEASEYNVATMPYKNPTRWQLIKRSLPFPWNFYSESMLRESDEMSEGRMKIIHPYGSVAKIDWRIFQNSSIYTGVFKTSGIGLARLSVGRMSLTPKDIFYPGMSIKLFIDHEPSVNFHIINSMDGQAQDRNFFKMPFSNIVARAIAFRLKILERFAHCTVDRLPDGDNGRPENERVLPLFEGGLFETNGTKVAQPVFPRQIMFTPNPELSTPSTTDVDFRLELNKIKEGTVLYQISVIKEQGATPEVIGEIVTRSRFISSDMGDSKLFFKHMRRRGF